MKQLINRDTISAEMRKHLQSYLAIPHRELLNDLLKKIDRVSFKKLAELKEEDEHLAKKHLIVCSIQHILDKALLNNWGICKYQGFIYLYNGAFWNPLDNEELQTFLGEAAEKMGVDKFDAQFYPFREQLYKQFLSAANLPKPQQPKNVVYINLLNGTFEISPDNQVLREPI